MSSSNNKKCAKCGAPFDCQVDGDYLNCWCNSKEFKPYIPRLAAIAGELTGCICKSCMINLPPLEKKEARKK